MPHRKFSQEELELAYKQMEIERKKDELTAKKAVGFLKIKLNQTQLMFFRVLHVYMNTTRAIKI